MAEGMPEKQARAKASKQANEDARFVLPNACETKMVVTMTPAVCRISSICAAAPALSGRSVSWLRRCSGWSTRWHPISLPSGPACVSGPCPEGRMCCGRTAEVRAKYEAIKQEAGV